MKFLRNMIVAALAIQLIMGGGINLEKATTITVQYFVRIGKAALTVENPKADG
ncbi:MAG: hypothetical protein AAFV72_00100 [Cyanobacteria bacterium J06635_1]